MAYQNIWENEGVYSKFQGTIDAEEVHCAVDEVESDTRFDSIRYVINDFLEATEFTVTPKDISVRVAIDNAAARTNPDIRIALVTVDQIVKDLIGIYIEQMESSPYETRIFATLDEARRWLT